MSISKKQIDILYKSKLFINKAESNFLSGLLYLNSWDSFSIGNAFLRFKIMNSTSKFRFYTKLIKNILGIRFLNNLTVLKSNLSFSKFDSIIFSWCKSTDFDEDGNYNDRYFNVCSNKNKNYLWFLISTDQIIPNKTDNNIQILYRKPSNFFSQLFFIIKTVSKNFLLKNKRGLDISYEQGLAEKISEFIKISNNFKSISRIIQPYEGQPFQHAINLIFEDLNIKTIGYLHSLLPPLPTDLVYRNGAPNILYVHGLGQINIMRKFLNWNSNLLKFTPAYRFKKNDTSFSGIIFLPYDFTDQKLILDSLEFFLKNSKDESLPFFKIKSHPVKLNSSKHINLINKINFLIKKYEIRFSSKIIPNKSVVIGVSAVIMEALERDVKTIIHIVNNPILDSHQNILWEAINVKFLTKHMYQYKLVKKNHYIHLGDNNLSLKKLI